MYPYFRLLYLHLHLRIPPLLSSYLPLPSIQYENQPSKLQNLKQTPISFPVLMLYIPPLLASPTVITYSYEYEDSGVEREMRVSGWVSG